MLTAKWKNSILIFLVSLSSLAQNEVSFSLVAEKNKASIGEPIAISMRLTYPSNLDPSTISFPVFEDSTKLTDSIDINAIKNAETKSIIDNQNTTLLVWQQDFSISIFAGGNIAIPVFQAIIGVDTIASNALTIQIDAPEVDLEKDFIGIKGITKDPFSFWEKVGMWFRKNWIWVVAALLLIVGSIIGYHYYKRKPEPPAPSAPKIPLTQLLLTQLEEIENKELWQNNKHKQYYTEVIDVLRKFLEHNYKIATLEKTSHEILGSLKMTPIGEEEYTQIKKSLALSDMAKFAKTVPLPEENNAVMNIVRTLLQKQDTFNKYSKEE